MAVKVPFRLDLTVSVLRRLSTNLVDVITAEAEYVRVLSEGQETVVARVSQHRPDALTVILEGGAHGHGGHGRTLTILERMLGVECDLSSFDRAARDIPWLAPLAVRMRGVKPPRYPTLWEACVNAVLFQQLSLISASAISRRMVMALSGPAPWRGTALYKFPAVETFQDASDDVLLAVGLSANKLGTLRRVADALLSGVLDEASLEALPSPGAAAQLCQIKGVGPWTATVILLRGLGRLDVFPLNDSSVARNLAFVAGSTPLDIDQALTALGSQRGVLYYHLLLSRLEARGDLVVDPAVRVARDSTEFSKSSVDNT
jgi:DNA-3-methyladenine glycosylase II